MKISRIKEAEKQRSQETRMESLKILYEDDYLLVVEKPAGVPCLPGKKSRVTTLAGMIADMRPLLVKIGKENESGIVHRLDNDTSGLVLAAKTEKSYENLRRQFSNKAGTKVLKEYAALVVGNPPEKGRIDLPIAHHPSKKKKMVACESEKKAVELKARGAVTNFKTIKRFRMKTQKDWTMYSLLLVDITTGVRHQIRAHLAAIGFPLAGDGLYQNSKKRNEDRLGLNRHFLHATGISFLHPTRDERIEISSDLAEDLKDALSLLETIGD